MCIVNFLRELAANCNANIHIGINGYCQFFHQAHTNFMQSYSELLILTCFFILIINLHWKMLTFYVWNNLQSIIFLFFTSIFHSPHKSWVTNIFWMSIPPCSASFQIGAQLPCRRSKSVSWCTKLTAAILLIFIGTLPVFSAPANMTYLNTCL